MANVDRGYILSLLTQTKTSEDGRLAFYSTQPYPAMHIIAEDRVESLRLLIDAVEDGLLERLLVEASARDAEERTAREYEAHEANEAWLDAHPDEFVDENAETEDGYTGEQLNGNACSVCNGQFKTGEASQPSGYVIDHGQLFAHTACLDDGEVD